MEAIKERLYICNIEKSKGLFVKNNIDMYSLDKTYSLVFGDNGLVSVYDIALDILDEDIHKVLICLNKENIQLSFSIMDELFKEEFYDIILYSNNPTCHGTILYKGNKIKVISSLVDIDLNIEDNTMLDYAKLVDFFHRNEINAEEKQTLINGYKAYMTGAYMDRENYAANIKHLEIEEKVKFNFSTLNKEIINLNSALLFNVDTIKSDFYNTKINNEEYIYPHVHQIAGDKVKFDNSKTEETFKKVKYSDYKGERDVYLEILDSSDLTALKEDIDYFSKTGIIRKLGCYFVNRCSFEKGICKLTKIKRCRTNQELDFLPCLNSSKSIGKITDDYFDILKHASREQNQIRLKRNCAQCEAQRYCPQCAMLPDQIKSSEYCEFMINDSLIYEYMAKYSIFNDLVKESILFKGNYNKEILISNREYPLVCNYQYKKGQYKDNGVLTCFRLDKEYYILTFASHKVYQVDEKLVYIAESMMRGMNPQELERSYSNMFNLTIDEAREHLSEAIRVIVEEKII